MSKTHNPEPRVAVYTAITSGRDLLKEDQCFEGADFFAFTDVPMSRSGWRILPACDQFETPRLNAKAHKLLPHTYLPHFDYSLWLDGSIRLLQPVRKLIDLYLSNSDLAVFAHATRDCLYDEAEYCRTAGRDDPAIIDAQVARYRAEGYPAHNGLIEAGVLLRRHTPLVERFDNVWWDEIRRGSVRDQISINYALRTVGLEPEYLPGTIYTSEYVDVQPHATA